MDSQFDLEELRAKLKAMPRPKVLELAASAGVPHSTVEKFRNGHTADPGAQKVLSLIAALRAKEAEGA